jgi:hypothetical protein
MFVVDIEYTRFYFTFSCNCYCLKIFELYICNIQTLPLICDIILKTKDPPEGPPVIDGYRNDTVHQVVESESGSTNCSVVGGNPLATLTLTCFNKQSTTVTITDTTVTSYISWKAMRNQNECTCESDHIIGGKQITNLTFEVLCKCFHSSFYFVK